MKRVRRTGVVAVSLVLATALAACSGADAPPEATSAPTEAPATTEAGAASDTTEAAAPGSTAPGDTSSDTTAASSGDGPAGVKEGADTILTPEPTGEADSAVWAVYRETSTIDPIYVFDYPDNAAMAIACESLLRQEPDLTIGPGLATSVEYTDDTHLVITLRDGVTFWDGTPLTPADVVFSLERQRDPNLGGFYAAVLSKVDTIEATGDLEVTITTTARDNQLVGELSGPVGAVVQQAYTEAQGANFATAAGGVMCTGPYELDSWVVGEGLTFVRNDAYWDTSLPMKLKSITIKGVSDEAVATSGFLTGEIDGGYPITIATLDQLRDSDAVNVYEGPGYGISAFIVSSFDGALKDKRVRQALSMALDRQGLVDALYKGAGYPARAPAVPGTWGFEKQTFTDAWNALPDVSTPNLEEAKALVEEAGATGQTVRLGMSSELNAINVTAGEFQRALESIGMKAELVSVSAANYISFFIDPAARADVDGFFTVNYPNYADPFGLYATMIGPDGSQAFNGYADPAAIDLVDQIRTAPDQATQADLEVQLQSMIMDEMLWVPIVAPTNVLVMSKDLTGAPSTFSYMFGPWAAYLGAA
ncbi:MAG: ABC transporter substrate-binding protein [Acidimicrobiales bacterium]